MRDIHRWVGWTLIGVNALAGAWCLAAYQWARLRSRPMWATVIVGQVLVFAQATLGALISRQEGIHLGEMHALYGFSAIVAVMIMYGYRTSPFLQGKQLVLYGLGSLFIMGLGLRNLYLH